MKQDGSEQERPVECGDVARVEPQERGPAEGFPASMRRLDLENGKSVVVIRIPAGQPEGLVQRMKAAGRQWLNAHGLERCPLLVMADGLNVEAFPLEYMARCGWVKVPRTAEREKKDSN